MKFCNYSSKSIFRLALVIAMLITLSGCATLDYIMGKPEQVEDKKSEVQEQSAADATQNAGVSTDGTETLDPGTKTLEAAQDLTAEQMRIVKLEAQPNLYFAGSPLPPEAAAALFEQAIEAKQQNEFDRAETLFTQLTQDFPNLSGPFMQLGDLVLNRQKIDADSNEEQFQAALSSAANYYQQAISANQHNYFAQNRLAKIYREQGQFELAESHYKQAIDSWPAFDKAYLNLGILYDLYLGKKVLALRQYETYQGLQANPGRKVNGWIADMKRQIARANSQ